jgi:hypothetical protein
MTEDGTQRGERRQWVEDSEKALEGVGEALRAAWDASRGSRVSALESAKAAARQLGEAIDRGMTAARERWDAPEEEAGPDGDSGPATRPADTPPSPEVDVTPADPPPPSPTDQPPPPPERPGETSG